AQHCLDSSAHRFNGIVLASPPQRFDLCAIKANDRHVAFPPSVATSKFISNTASVEASFLNDEIRYLADGNIIVCRNIEHVIVSAVRSLDNCYSGKDILDINITLSLRSIAQNMQPRGVGFQIADEVIANPMGLSRADDISKSKGSPTHSKHVAVGRNQTL